MRRPQWRSIGTFVGALVVVGALSVGFRAFGYGLGAALTVSEAAASTSAANVPVSSAPLASTVSAAMGARNPSDENGSIAATCSDRPRVSVSVIREAGGLRATIAAGTSAAVPNNRLTSIRIGSAANGVVDLRDRIALPSNSSVALPDRPSSVSLLIRRTGTSGSVTIPLIVSDDCGGWPTFVGGGSSQFGEQPNPPATPQPTPVPTPPAVGACGEAMDAWHPPVINGCTAGHEHGDPPPSWIGDAGYTVSFSGPFNTTARENTTKHAAMKAFLARFSGVDIYFRIHAASNVLDRSARYHSYDVWTRDAAGGVSHWQGWFNTGDPVADRIPRSLGDPGRRPLMLVVDRASWDADIRCEQWYGLTASWSWDFGWTICNVNSLFYPGENNEQDMAQWRLPPGGPSLGGLRRLEAAWYSSSSPGRQHPTGRFWATQFGEIVGGPTDTRCSGTSTRFGTTYANVCLEQYIAPTMTQVAFPGNAVQKTFPTTGVQIPN
ncbi:MAG: hypothetical protein IT305_18365 [Chloroflexi bacterium]|nr:hypothetical protein [Chloroflexota bacterium]